MSRQRILLKGPASGALAAAAVLAARWAGGGREVVVCPDDAESPGELLLRPSHAKVHSLLGIGLHDLQHQADARPLLALPVQAGAEKLRLPFTEFGLAYSGVDFHHFWKRGSALSALPDLSHFSLALALDDHREKLTLQHVAKLPVKLGLRLNRGKYAEMVQRLIEQAGVRVVGPSELSSLDTDLTIHCGAERHSGVISGSELHIGGYPEFPDTEWQLATNCAARLAALGEATNPRAPERSEFNRLAQMEADRISDMRVLLSAPEPQSTHRPELKRKVDVFAACGRIPMEDFEYFLQPEWLAALWACGFRPERADRMAQIMPEAELNNWLSALHQQVQQIASAGGAL